MPVFWKSLIVVLAISSELGEPASLVDRMALPRWMPETAPLSSGSRISVMVTVSTRPEELT